MEGDLPFLVYFTLHLREISEYKPPGGAYVWRGDLRKVFLALPVWGLIYGGAYFRNFTVTCWDVVKCKEHSVKTFIVLF